MGYLESEVYRYFDKHGPLKHLNKQLLDRHYNTTLPGLQTELAEQVLALGKPTVLVLIHGGAMSLGPLKDKFHAIVDAFCTPKRPVGILCVVSTLTKSVFE